VQPNEGFVRQLIKYERKLFGVNTLAPSDFGIDDSDDDIPWCRRCADDDDDDDD
jgi:hypothetical protein